MRCEKLWLLFDCAAAITAFYCSPGRCATDSIAGQSSRQPANRHDPMAAENLLIVADSEHDADMLYAMRMFVPDPFIYLRIDGKSYAVMSDAEMGRARKG